MENKIIFITGAEGVGKTSIIKLLKLNFKEFEIYDFDEVGVPENPPLSWRYETTKHWLKVGEENLKKKKSTIICGLTIPSEIEKFSSKRIINYIQISLLDVSIEERERRLRKRSAPKELIDYTGFISQLKKEFKKSKLKGRFVIDTTNFSIKEVGKLIIDWINNIEK